MEKKHITNCLILKSSSYCLGEATYTRIFHPCELWEYKQRCSGQKYSLVIIQNHCNISTHLISYKEQKNPEDLPDAEMNIFLCQIVQHTTCVSAGDKIIRNMYASAKPLITCVSQSDSREYNFRECHRFFNIHLAADPSKL